jgi:hypothetical protein
MRASKRSIGRWFLAAALLTPATSRARAAEQRGAAPADPAPAEMLLELDLLADPGFDRRSSVRGESASPGGRTPLEDFDLDPDSDESKPEPRSRGR